MYQKKTMIYLFLISLIVNSGYLKIAIEVNGKFSIVYFSCEYLTYFIIIRRCRLVFT